MKLQRLLSEALKLRGKSPDSLPPRSSAEASQANPEVRGLTYDSRLVEPGSLFFALAGEHTDGARFAEDALDRGAVAVVSISPAPARHPSAVPWVQVTDPHVVMSAASHVFHGKPSENLPVIGITGTDGKSSTAWFAWQLCRAMGKRPGLVTTPLVDTGEGPQAAKIRQSTPEAPVLHGLLSRMLDNGCNLAVVECTSHGLSPRTARLAHLRICHAAFTNLSPEHLEFHGTFANYRRDKLRLFDALADPAAVCADPSAVVNADDPNAAHFAERARSLGVALTLIGERAEAEAEAGDRVVLMKRIVETQGAVFCSVHADGQEHELRVPVPGRFNLWNALTSALLASAAAGRPLAETLQHCGSLRPLVGRMEQIRQGQPFGVIVDYAHTPGSFAEVFRRFRDACRGRLIAVFGSAGERDLAKRPEQGRIAADYADVVVITDEDPRGEDRMKILRDIAAGITRMDREVLLIPDRRQAIREAFGRASGGDLVVLLGKGHESSIEMPDGSWAWNEQQEARNALAELGYNQD